MKKLLIFTLITVFSSCATQKLQYASKSGFEKIDTNGKEVEHTFYLIGDAGLSPMGELNPALKAYQQLLSSADKNSTAVFLGDNVYPKGIPSKKHKDYKQALWNMEAQLKTLENFKGDPVIIPGNHDWYNGLKGLKRQEKYVEKYLDNDESFFPEKGCAVQKINISEDIVLITIDSEWYLANWDKNPGINDKCNLKSRNAFFAEVEGLIKKNRDKTTLIAIHHPVFSYGEHAGHYNVKKQFYPGHNKVPLPVLGSMINFLRKTTGASHQDMYNARYRELKNRLLMFSHYNDNVIFMSGHEHNSQYIVQDEKPQIVAGSGAKYGPARVINGSQFSSGALGYTVLKVYTDGSSSVEFYNVDDQANPTMVFNQNVLPPKHDFVPEVTADFPATVTTSVYPAEDTEKGALYRWLWGERYRKYFGIDVTAPTVNLDTVFGGIKPVRKGGGNQSISIRLANDEGQEYVMRAVKKSAESFIQTNAFPNQYVLGQYENTATEKFLFDFYTASHPYTPFTISKLADAVGVFHTNPKLYYIPKQPALGKYNDEFGDELYQLEERTGDGHGDKASFGNANKMISTKDLYAKLRKSDKHKVDLELFVRSRLFDMLLGDWDRHQDQWRWGVKDMGEYKLYQPIPRDRDQAFGRMNQGAFMKFASTTIPALQKMQEFDENIKNVRTFNTNPYRLDLTFLSQVDYSVWEKEIAHIQQNMTPEAIDAAFADFPDEVKDELLDELKETLLIRLSNMPDYAREYFEVINKYAIVAGTDKDDRFEVKMPDNKTIEVEVYRKVKGDDRLFFKRTYTADVTKEIWLYGLDDKDVYNISSDVKSKIKLRLIGGYGEDRYVIPKNQKAIIYDYKSLPNDLEKNDGAREVLTDQYDINTYQPLDLLKWTNQFMPAIASNPDDGLRVGFSNTYTHQAYLQDPYTSRHKVAAAYYFATEGIDASYEGLFAFARNNWQFGLDAAFNSPEFSQNFFGYGNETVYTDENDDDFDFNRTRIQRIEAGPSINYIGDMGSRWKIGANYQQFEVERTRERFVEEYFSNIIADPTDYLNLETSYRYKNQDNVAFPTVGMSIDLTGGYTMQLEDTDVAFLYVKPELSFIQKIIPNGKLVYATKFLGHIISEDDFRFYQAASIGGNNGLRGYRNERFTGKQAFAHQSDLRWKIKDIRTAVMPLAFGLTAGFDYGRVWMPNEDSDTWHNNYGGGLIIEAANTMSLQTTLFNGDDGLRFVFAAGFGF